MTWGERFLRRMLCRIGRHQWIYRYEGPITKPGTYSLGCQRCGWAE